MNTMHVKKGDTVVVLSGKEKGKKGKVLTAVPKTGMVVVEGVNMVTCHTKARRPGEQGGIVKKEGALRACKVQLVCPKCDKGTRVKVNVLPSGERVRVCKHCGENI